MRIRRSLGLGAKVQALTLLMGGLLLVVGGVSVYSLHRVSTAYRQVADLYMPLADAVDVLLAESRESLLVTALLAQPGLPPATVSKLNGEAEVLNDRYFSALKRARDLLAQRDKDTSEFDTIVGQWAELTRIGNDLSRLSLSRDPQDREKAVQLIQGDFLSARGRYYEILQKRAELEREQSAKAAESAKLTARAATILSVFLVLAGFAAALLSAPLVARALARKIREVCGRMSDSSSELSAASRQILRLSEMISAGLQSRASSLQETASTANELSAMGARIAEGTRESLKTSEEGRAAVSAGSRALSDLKAAISITTQTNLDVLAQLEESNRSVGEIAKLFADISGRTQVIKDIVFQTKLLSFNASVEAARAGEHGKGFSVVAEEVGKLARMSGEAAQGIFQLIRGSQERLEAIRTTMKSRAEALSAESNERIRKSEESVEASLELLKGITQATKAIDGRIRDIAAAQEDQARGITEIDRAIGELDAGAQKDGKVSAAAAGAARQLLEQAVELEQLSGRLLAAVDGGSPAAKDAATAETTATDGKAASDSSSGSGSESKAA